MILVCNTSPIIFMAKLGVLDWLKRYRAFIPEQVLAEIRKGEGNDVSAIDELLKKQGAQIVPVHALKDLPDNLGEGEQAAISLAAQKHADFILVDEARARKVARLYGLHPRGTIGMIWEEYLKKRITKNECKRHIIQLVTMGYRIREELLLKILEDL